VCVCVSLCVSACAVCPLRRKQERVMTSAHLRMCGCSHGTLHAANSLCYNTVYMLCTLQLGFLTFKVHTSTFCVPLHTQRFVSPCFSSPCCMSRLPLITSYSSFGLASYCNVSNNVRYSETAFFLPSPTSCYLHRFLLGTPSWTCKLFSQLLLFTPLFTSYPPLLDSFNSLLLLCARRRWNWPSA